MTDKPQLPSGQIVTWNEEKQTIYYSNVMGISMTPFDIGVIFAQIGRATPSELEGVVGAKVILAPEQVQNLIKLLTISLQKYVEANGTLRISGALNEDVFTSAFNSATVKSSNEG